MSLSAIALCSRALLRIGAHAINSFDDATMESDLAAAFYTPVRDGLLSAYGWSFATAQVTLNRLTASPLADYDYAFELPNDYLRALSAGVPGAGRGTAFRIFQNQLHANNEAVILTYIARVAEVDCPPFFDSVLLARLTAEFCIPLTESTSRAQILFTQAEAEFKRAKSIDAQQDTPAALDDFTLIGVRN